MPETSRSFNPHFKVKITIKLQAVGHPHMQSIFYMPFKTNEIVLALVPVSPLKLFKGFISSVSYYCCFPAVSSKQKALVKFNLRGLSTMHTHTHTHTHKHFYQLIWHSARTQTYGAKLGSLMTQHSNSLLHTQNLKAIYVHSHCHTHTHIHTHTQTHQQQWRVKWKSLPWATNNKKLINIQHPEHNPALVLHPSLLHSFSLCSSLSLSLFVSFLCYLFLTHPSFFSVNVMLSQHIRDTIRRESICVWSIGQTKVFQNLIRRTSGQV